MLLALLLTPAALADGRLLIVSDRIEDIYVDGDYIDTDTTAWLPLEEGMHRVRIGDDRTRVYIEDGEEARVWYFNGRLENGQTIRFKRRRSKGWHQRPDDNHHEYNGSSWHSNSSGHGQGSYHYERSNSPGTVQIVSRDGEWVNVWIDGEEVAELRNFADKSKSVELSPGYHSVEVWDFMNNEVLVKGRIYVEAGEQIRIGVYDNRVEAYGDGSFR